MLNRDDIASAGIIIDGVKNERAASYDVRVGTVIAMGSDNKIHVEHEFYKVDPHGMIEVISLETIKVPDNIAGYASVMTRLSRGGFLALNTGIVDPGYEGPVSAVMVNFGNIPICLSRGDPFLRLTFHRYQPPQDLMPICISRERFIEDRKKEAGQRFSESFLDITAQIDEIARGAFRRYLGRLVIFVGILALMVTFVTFGVTIGVNFWQARFLSKDQVRAAVDDYFLSDDFKSIKSELTGLQKEELRKEVRASVQQALDEEHAKTANSTRKGSVPMPRQPSARGARTR
jgi:deoxycytidine triphosphate deaminase